MEALTHDADQPSFTPPPRKSPYARSSACRCLKANGMRIKPDLRRKRTPFNNGTDTVKEMFRCDECGVLFAKGRSAKRQSELRGSTHDFCGKPCCDAWHARNVIRGDHGEIVGYRNPGVPA